METLHPTCSVWNPFTGGDKNGNKRQREEEERKGKGKGKGKDQSYVVVQDVAGGVFSIATC